MVTPGRYPLAIVGAGALGLHFAAGLAAAGPVALVARNAGVVAADGAVLADAVPAGIASFAWSCTSTGAATAVFTPASGTGAVNVTLGTFPPGAAVSCAVTAQTSASLPAEVKNARFLAMA